MWCARAGAKWRRAWPLASIVNLHMNIAKVLSSAAALKATEARVTVGEPTVLIVRGEVRTLFASTVSAADFESGVVQRLDAFRREELRTARRCRWQFEEKGIGKIQAEIEPNKATFALPTTPHPQSGTGKSQDDAPGESKRGLFAKLLGGK